MAFKVLGILNSPYMQTYDKIEMLRSCMAISNSAEKSREWKNAYQNLIWVMIKNWKWMIHREQSGSCQ